MSGIFGLLGLQDTDRSFVSTIGQQVVFDAVNALLQQYNADLEKSMNVFIERTTESFKLRYKLPGGGRLQRRGGLSPSGVVKASGSWDVAFPLEDFGAGLAGDDVTLAYMDVQELNRHLDTITLQDINTVRFEMLRALFNNTERTFSDPIHGDLLVEPLANTDGTLYPPQLGSETEAEAEAYAGTNYAYGSISDTYNPLILIRDKLESHFGATQGGSNICVFINNEETAKVSALTDFGRLGSNFVTFGTTTAIADMQLPNVPGKLIGYCNGVWVSEWRWIPAGYMLGLHLDAPKPIMQRVDPADTGLPQGLTLVSKSIDYPLQDSQYRHRFGLGVGNRLNGVVYQLVASTSYTIPTAYA